MIDCTVVRRWSFSALPGALAVVLMAGMVRAQDLPPDIADDIDDALSGPVLVRLAILREVGQTALMLGCVRSNEVDVRPAF